MRIGKSAFPLALRCLPILLSGALVFPTFVAALDASVVRFYLDCRHVMHEALRSPSGRYEAVVTSYHCPTRFYPSLTVGVRLRALDSVLPDVLSGTEVFWFGGYRSKVGPDDLVRWEGDARLTFGGPRPEDSGIRNK